MKVQHTILSAVLVLSFFSASFAISPSDARLVQISTVNAILAGEYDGVATIQQVLDFGNFGIGTVNAIDGELTVIGGVPYVAKADGTVTIAPNTETVPFASVFHLDREKTKRICFDHPVSHAEFTAAVDRLAPNPNIFYALLFEGTFSYAEVRSEKGQAKPYRPLAETMETAEVRFSLGEGRGVLVGFRSPGFISGLNVPGDHLHFLSYSRTEGGHVLDFGVKAGLLYVQPIPAFLMYLPETLEINPAELSRDRSEELNRVEK